MKWFLCLLVIVTLTYGCHRIGFVPSFQKRPAVLHGTFRAENRSLEEIWVTFKMPTFTEGPMYIMPGTGANQMAYAIPIGEPTSLSWTVVNEDGEQVGPERSVSFDTTPFADIVDQVQGMFFIYDGNNTWRLRVVGKRVFRYDDPFLREIQSIPAE